jgi:hypothetical protein
VTWAFVPKAVLGVISGDGKDAQLAQGSRCAIPISADYEVMRTSLLPGLADALKRNLSRGLAGAWLFEVGPSCAGPPATMMRPVESTHAAGLIAGNLAGWLKPGEPVDFYDLKSVVEILLRGFGMADVDFEPPATLPFLHPGVSAQIRTKQGVRARLPRRIAPGDCAQARHRRRGLLLRGRSGRPGLRRDPLRTSHRRAFQPSRATSRSGSIWRRQPRPSARPSCRRKSRSCATWPCWKISAIPSTRRLARRACCGP